MPENKNTLSAPLSTTGSLSGRITVGSVEYYDKHTLDQLLVGKADVEHSHDDKYITKDTYSYNLNVWSMNLTELKNIDAEIKTSLEGKADSNHTHSYNELTDLPELGDLEIDTSNLATKEELNGKADVDHNHIIKDGLMSLDLQGAYDLLKQIKIDKYQMKQYAAPIEHTHEEYLTEHQDLSHLATKAALEEEVARAKAREDEIAAEIDDEEPYMADLAAYPTSKFLFACGHPVYAEGQEDGSVVVSFKAMGENKEIVLSAEDAAKTYIVGGYGHDNHNSKRSLPMTKVVARNAKIKGIVGGHYFEGIVGHAHIEAENCQMVSVIAGGWCGAKVDGRTTRLNIVHKAECKLTNCTVSSTFFGGSQGNGTVDESHVVLDGVKAGWATVGGSNGLTNEGHLEVKGESEIDVLQTVNRGLVRKARVDIHEGQVKQLFVGGETEDSTVNGIVNEVEMNLMGGVVDKLRLGTSEGQPFAGQLEGSMRQPEVKESEVDLGLFKVIEDEVLPEYALKDHTHEGMATEEYVNEKIDSIDIPEVDLSGLATKEELNGKADKNHNHNITWDGGETVDLQTAFDYVAYYKANKNHTHDQYLTEHQDISGKADITYVDNAINTALNGIESQLDQIIGEEV